VFALQESGMAANYVANFCDWAEPFLKFQKNRQKIAVLIHFSSALKPAFLVLV